MVCLIPEYVLHILSRWRMLESRLKNSPQTGAELVAYWEREGLISTRPDIQNSQEHARSIHTKVEQREQARD